MKSLTPLTLTLWHQSNRCYFLLWCQGVKVSRCQSDISMASTLLIQAYKSAHTSIIDRLSIEFASNLHRLCNGGSLEDHWCVYTVSIDTFKIDILLYYTPYLWIKHKNRQPSPFALKPRCTKGFGRWRLVKKPSPNLHFSLYFLALRRYSWPLLVCLALQPRYLKVLPSLNLRPESDLSWE